MFFIGAAAMCICCRKQGRIKWAQGPLNAQGNWVAFHIPRFNLAKPPVITDTIWQPTLQRQLVVIMYGGSYVFNSVNLFKHAMMRLQFALVRSFDCRGRLRNQPADCSLAGFHCVTITRQYICKRSFQVTVVGVFPHVNMQGSHCGVSPPRSAFLCRPGCLGLVMKNRVKSGIFEMINSSATSMCSIIYR